MEGLACGAPIGCELPLLQFPGSYQSRSGSSLAPHFPPCYGLSLEIWPWLCPCSWVTARPRVFLPVPGRLRQKVLRNHPPLYLVRFSPAWAVHAHSQVSEWEGYILRFPFSLPGLLLEPILLCVFAWSHPGWNVDCPLVGLVGERLTAGVLGTSCGWWPGPCALVFLGNQVLQVTVSRAVSPRFPPTSSVVYCLRYWGSPLLILQFPGLWPFSLLLYSAWFWTHCVRLRPSLLFSGRSIRVDFLGFLRLVRPNLSSCPLPL